MNTDYVNLENAQGLAEVGYPQDQFPQRVWCAYILTGPRGPDPEGGFWDCTYEQHSGRVDTDSEIAEWYAAPTHLAAFRFFASKKGTDYCIDIDLIGNGSDYKLSKWDRKSADWVIEYGMDTPDDLIAAILKSWKEGNDGRRQDTD